MRLRIATMADEIAVTEVLRASYRTLLAADYPPAKLAETVPLMENAQPALLQSGSYYVVEDGAGIAACGGWTAEEPGTGNIMAGIGHVRHFATHPARTRRGAAGMILRKCMEAAGQAGYTSLHAYSTRTAVGFYRRHGFKHHREFDAEFPGGATLPSVEMRLALARNPNDTN